MAVSRDIRTPVVALIVAAGRGARAGEGLPKQYRRIAGLSVLHRSIVPFLHHPGVDHVAVVIHPDDRGLYDEAVGDLGGRLLTPIDGGPTRQASVLRGLEGLRALAPGLVLIHDAARPFVTDTLVSRVLAGAREHSAVVPAVEVVDTIRQVDGAGRVIATPDRASLRAVQTPQAFHFDALLAAHRAQSSASNLTDDGAVMEASGHGVFVVDGDASAKEIRSNQVKCRLPLSISVTRNVQHFAADRAVISDTFVACTDENNPR